MPQEPRGVGCGEEYPLPAGEGSGEGAVLLGPSPKIFSYILLKIPYFDAFCRVYFLKSYANGRGSNPPNPILGTLLAIPIHSYSVTVMRVKLIDRRHCNDRSPFLGCSVV